VDGERTGGHAGGTANFDVPLPSPAGIGVIAERDGDHFVLNGRKYWPSSPGWDARGTNMSTVIVRTDPDRGRTEGLSALVVERDTPGVSYSFINKMGHRLAANAEVVFDNARVPAANLLEGAAGSRWTQPTEWMTSQRSSSLSRSALKALTPTALLTSPSSSVRGCIRATRRSRG
jgi:alkylation response protein AidB-like acyl-CoA dehydrogenase